MITLEQAGIDDCLTAAGGRRVARRRMIAMRQTDGVEAVRVLVDGEQAALAFLVPDGRGKREFCLSITSRARAHMRELCRAAQLILGRMAEDGPIICHVVPTNRAGRRMARIVGFIPDPDNAFRWTMEPADDRIRQSLRQQRRRQAGEGSPPAAGGDQ